MAHRATRRRGGDEHSAASETKDHDVLPGEMAQLTGQARPGVRPVGEPHGRPLVPRGVSPRVVCSFMVSHLAVSPGTRARPVRIDPCSKAPPRS